MQRLLVARIVRCMQCCVMFRTEGGSLHHMLTTWTLAWTFHETPRRAHARSCQQNATGCSKVNSGFWRASSCVRVHVLSSMWAAKRTSACKAEHATNPNTPEIGFSTDITGSNVSRVNMNQRKGVFTRPKCNLVAAASTLSCVCVKEMSP